MVSLTINAYVNSTVVSASGNVVRARDDRLVYVYDATPIMIGLDPETYNVSAKYNGQNLSQRVALELIPSLSIDFTFQAPIAPVTPPTQGNVLPYIVAGIIAVGVIGYFIFWKH